MTAPTSELDQYEGKKVVLTVSDAEAEGGTKTLEGKAEKANAMGVLLKPKGKTGLELHEASTIVSIEAAPEKPKEIKAKSLKLIEATNAKQHLVDRHGYTLSDINSMEDEAAFTFHNETVDHADLGHTHAAKEETPAEADSAEEPAA